MKKIKFLGLLLSTLIVMSCSSDDGAENTASFMRATIGSDYWESSSIEYSNMIRSTSENSQRYDLRGISDDFKVNVSIAEATASDCMTIGSYTGDNVLLAFHYHIGNGNFLLEHYPTPLDGSADQDIVVEVTSCSGGLISGTFSGTLYKQVTGGGYESISITEGEFQNIPYQVFDL